jgi:hypothetical protein
MDLRAIRLTIRHRLEKGLLPMERARRVRGHPPSGEACDGCDLLIATGQLAMGGLARMPGRKTLQLHLRCFEIWTEERSALERARAGNGARPLPLGHPA